MLAGKTLFNYALFLAIAAVAIPGFAILLEWTVAAPVQLVVIVVLAGWGLAAVSTFLSALVAQAGQKNVLFVVIFFPDVAAAAAVCDLRYARRDPRRRGDNGHFKSLSPTMARRHARLTCWPTPCGRIDVMKLLKGLLLPFMASMIAAAFLWAETGAGVSRRVVANRFLPCACAMVGALASSSPPCAPSSISFVVIQAWTMSRRCPSDWDTLRGPDCRHRIALREDHVGLLLELGSTRVLLSATDLSLRGLPLPARAIHDPETSKTCAAYASSRSFQ